MLPTSKALVTNEAIALVPSREALVSRNRGTTTECTDPSSVTRSAPTVRARRALRQENSSILGSPSVQEERHAVVFGRFCRFSTSRGVARCGGIAKVRAWLRLRARSDSGRVGFGILVEVPSRMTLVNQTMILKFFQFANGKRLALLDRGH